MLVILVECELMTQAAKFQQEINVTPTVAAGRLWIKSKLDSKEEA